MRLILFLSFALAGGTGVRADPPPSAKQAGEKPALSANDNHTLTDLYGDPLPSGTIARLGTVRFRHGSWLRDVLVSPDGHTLISAGDPVVDMWDAQTGRRQRQFVYELPYILDIALSPGGKILTVGQSTRQTMRFWDPTNGTEIHPFGDAPPTFLKAVFSPNGELLATLDLPRPLTVSVWDVRKGKKIRTMEGQVPLVYLVRSLAFSPNGKLLAFPHETGVRVWDVESGKELYHRDLGTKSPAGCVVFSADGKLLVAASNLPVRDKDYAIHLWDAATGTAMDALKGHERDIMALTVSPKDNVLASASRDGTIRFWDLGKRQEIGRAAGPHRDFIALHFSADGRILASGESNGVLRLWEPHQREELASSAQRGNTLQWAKFAPDGKTLISLAKEQIGLWEPLSGRPRRFCHIQGEYYSPALSPDGKVLATVDRMGGQILLWDVSSGKLLRRLGEGGKPGLVSACIFSPDGRRLAGGSFQEDIIRIWDVASGKELQQLKGQQKASSFAFAPDGASLVSASVDARGDYTVRLWNLATGAEIWRKATQPWTAFALAFSPDGRTLALVGGLPGRLNTTGEVRLWEAATGKELKRLQGHRERVGCVAFSADGRMLVTGSLDNTIRLWEIATGQERRCLRGHQKSITAVSLPADGRLLASSSYDNTALVWDLTGRFREGSFPTRRLSAEELKRCWNDLAQQDAAGAYRGILSLTGSPKETVAFVKDHLAPLTAADPKRVTPLLADLESDQFAQRDKAMANLEQLGLAVELALHAALKAKPSLEVRQRIETILDKLAGGPRLRFLRALEVLEDIDTAEARQILETLSTGTAEMWPAQEAKKSLQRLRARPVVR